MAISYPLTFPQINNESLIEKMTVRLLSSSGLSESPYTYRQQVNNFGGARWEADVTLRPLTQHEAKAVKGFFASLKGRVGTFRLSNPTDTASGQANLNGAASVGDTELSITIGNGSIDAGDIFSLNNRIYMCLTTRNTSGDIDITPPIKEGVSDGSTVSLSAPVGTWRLADSEVEWDIDKASRFGFSFSCVEA